MATNAERCNKMKNRTNLMTMILTFMFIILMFVSSTVFALEASDTHKIKTIADPEVYIASDIGDGILNNSNKPESLNGKSPFDNQIVTILAIIKVKNGKDVNYYTDPVYAGPGKKYTKVYINDVEHTLKPWDDSSNIIKGTPEFEWYYLIPKYTEYTTTKRIPFKLEDITGKYGFQNWGREDKFYSPGTRRIMIKVTLGSVNYYNPVEIGEKIDKKDFNQFTEKNYRIKSSDAFKAHRISVRGAQFSDPLVQWASSYVGVNYIFGSTPSNVDNYEGTDCADLITGAMRQRFGKPNAGKIGYTNAEGLWKAYRGEYNDETKWYSNEVTKWDDAEQGYLVFRTDKKTDKKGNPYYQMGHVFFYSDTQTKNKIIRHWVVEAAAEHANDRRVQYHVKKNPYTIDNIKAKNIGRIVKWGDSYAQRLYKIIPPGQKQKTELPVDTTVAGMTISLTWPGSDLDLTLISPNGTIIDHDVNDSNIIYEEGENYESYTLNSSQPGNWTINVTAVDVPEGGENYTITIFLTSNLTLDLSMDKGQYELNDTLLMKANLSTETGIAGATVVAAITLPNATETNITLYDDGTHNDSVANDGVYTNTFNATSAEGVYFIDISANGTLNGYKFIREVHSYREVFPQIGRITGNYADYGLDLNGNGLFDFLILNVTVNITQASNFTVSGWLSFNNSQIASASNSTELSTGTKKVVLYFKGADVYRNKLNGSFEVSTVIYDEKNRKLNYDNDTYNTSSYNYTQFELPIVMLNENYSDLGNDTDSDGYYDFLTVNVGLNVSVAGNYTIKGWLNVLNFSDETNETDEFLVTEIEDFSYLSSGLQNKVLNFDGLSIYQSAMNGPYNLSVEVYDINGSMVDYQYDVYETLAYNYTQFKRPAALIVDNYSGYGLDLDSDGLYDYLIINVTVNVSKPGNYTLDAWLNKNGSEIEYVSNSTSLAAGIKIMQLMFDGTNFYKYKTNGPYMLDSLILYDENYTQMDYRSSMFNDTTNETIYVYATTNYSYSQFQRPVVDFLQFVDYTEPTLCPDVYKNLRLNITTSTSLPNGYILVAKIEHSSENYTLSSPVYTYINNTKNVSFVFSGEAIKEMKRNGTFNVTYLLAMNITGDVLNNLESNDLLSSFYTTASYNYTQFRLAGDVNGDYEVDIFDLARVGKCFSQTPAGFCEPADLDENGAINIFDLATVGINFGKVCGAYQTQSVLPSDSIMAADFVNQIYENQTFSVGVHLNTSNLTYAAEFSLYFNSSVLEAVNVTEGDFLNKDSASTYAIINVNNTEGRITFSDTRIETQAGVNGSGILANITFRAKINGSSILNLGNASLSDSNLTLLNASIVDGSVNGMNLSMSIQTLKDVYGANEDVNLTDPPDPENSSQETIHRLVEIGSNFEKYDNDDGTYTNIIYTSNMYLPDENGTWRNITDVVKFGHNGYNLTLNWYNYSVELEIGVVTNSGANYSMAKIKDMYPNVDFSKFITKYPSQYKWGINATIPVSVSANVKYIYIYLAKAENLSWDEVEIAGESITVKNIKFDYSDILNQGFTLSLYDKRTVLIGNVTNKTSIFIDPFVTAISPSEDLTLADAPLTPDYGILIKFSLSSIPAGSVIGKALLYLNKTDDGGDFTSEAILIYNCSGASGQSNVTGQNWTESSNAGDLMRAFQNKCTYTGNKTTVTTTNGMYSWDVTTSLTADFSTYNRENSTFMMNDSAITTAVAWSTTNTGTLRVGHTSIGNDYTASFLSRDGTGKNQPYLNITYYNMPMNVTFSYPTDPNNSIVTRNYTCINVTADSPNTIWNVKLIWNNTNMSIYELTLVFASNFNNNTNDWGFWGQNAVIQKSLGGYPNCSLGVPGRFGGGCSFNGTGWLNASWSAVLNVSKKNFTVEAWVHVKNNKTSDAFGISTVIAHQWNTNAIWGLFLENRTLKPEFWINNRTTNTIVMGTTGITQNAWYHLAGVFNGTHVLIYVNGLLNNSVACTNCGTYPTGEYSDLLIGGYNGWDWGMNGTVDEMRIYWRALPEKEINVSYNAELGRYYANMTHISNGRYEYYAWANNSGGASNVTGTRTLIIGASQSKIVNNGPTNASLYVLMKVQFYNSTAYSWVDDDIVVDDTAPRNLSVGSMIKLDSLFNGKWNTANASFGTGSYRVWAAVTDDSENVLKNFDGSDLMAYSNFTIS